MKSSSDASRRSWWTAPRSQTWPRSGSNPRPRGSVSPSWTHSSPAGQTPTSSKSKPTTFSSKKKFINWLFTDIPGNGVGLRTRYRLLSILGNFLPFLIFGEGIREQLVWLVDKKTLRFLCHLLTNQFQSYKSTCHELRIIRMTRARLLLPIKSEKLELEHISTSFAEVPDLRSSKALPSTYHIRRRAVKRPLQFTYIEKEG